MTMAIVTLYLGWSAGLVSYWFRAAVRRRVKRGGRRGVVLLQVYVRLVHPDDALVGKPVGLLHVLHRHLLAAVQPCCGRCVCRSRRVLCQLGLQEISSQVIRYSRMMENTETREEATS